MQTQFRASKTHALDMQKMCVVYEHPEAPRSNPGSFQDFDSVHVDIGYCTPTLPSGSLLFILNNSWLKGSGVEPQMKSLILATVWRLSFAMADAVCGVAFSIWLRPSGATAERLAEVIAQVAEQFQAPNFPPHVTLLGNAPKGGEINGCLWLEGFKFDGRHHRFRDIYNDFFTFNALGTLSWTC